jgi:hypothetical protein
MNKITLIPVEVAHPKVGSIARGLCQVGYAFSLEEPDSLERAD